MGNVLCVPKERKGRGSAKGTNDKKRVTPKHTRGTRRCQRSAEVDSRSHGVANDELLLRRNKNKEPTNSVSRSLSTDFVQAQPTSTDLSSTFSRQTAFSADEVSDIPAQCTAVQSVSAGNVETTVLPNATQEGPEHSSVEVHENDQTSFVQNIVEAQSTELKRYPNTNGSIIPASTAIDSVKTAENVTNGQGADSCEDLQSTLEVLEVESTHVNNDIDVSEKCTKMMGSTSTSTVRVDRETLVSNPLIHKIQQSIERSENPSADIKGNNAMIPNEGPVSCQNSTSISKKDRAKLEMSTADCGNDDGSKPNENCNVVDITFTKEPYHGDRDFDQKYKENLNGKDSVPCDITSVGLTTQTETSNTDIQPPRSDKSSINSDITGKGTGSDKTNSDLQKRNSLLKKQLIEAVKRNQELNVLHNRNERVDLIPRAKSFYRKNNVHSIKCKHDKLCQSTMVGEPVRKVSEFEVPKLPPPLPDMPTPLNKKTHVYKIPDVARSEAQNKITWRQTENHSSSGGQACVSRTPVFEPPTQPLGDRALEMFGSVDRMKKSWVIPECRQIETLKLEHHIYPGMYVYPHMRWQYTLDTTNKQDKSNRRRDSNKPRTNTVVNRRKMPEQQSKARPKSKSGGLTRWSRHDNLNNLRKDRH